MLADTTVLVVYKLKIDDSARKWTYLTDKISGTQIAEKLNRATILIVCTAPYLMNKGHLATRFEFLASTQCFVSKEKINWQHISILHQFLNRMTYSFLWISEKLTGNTLMNWLVLWVLKWNVENYLATQFCKTGLYTRFFDVVLKNLTGNTCYEVLC